MNCLISPQTSSQVQVWMEKTWLVGNVPLKVTHWVLHWRLVIYETDGYFTPMTL